MANIVDFVYFVKSLIVFECFSQSVYSFSNIQNYCYNYITLIVISLTRKPLVLERAVLLFRKSVHV